MPVAGLNASYNDLTVVTQVSSDAALQQAEDKNQMETPSWVPLASKRIQELESDIALLRSVLGVFEGLKEKFYLWEDGFFHVLPEKPQQPPMPASALRPGDGI
jgi:hypothetical protein